MPIVGIDPAHLDRGGKQPLYLQIARRLRTAIEAGRLAPGVRLPTIRALASHCGVTRVTAQKAYHWLARHGWVDSTVGRGTFVCDALPHEPPPGEGSPGDALAGMQWAAGRRGLTSLALAEGDLGFAPTAELARVVASLASRAENLLGYGQPQGDYFLRLQVARILGVVRGATVGPGQLLITGGSTSALSLVTDYLCQPGDTVVAEDPTYVGALSLFQTRRLRVLAMPVRRSGVDLARLARLLKRERPRLVYVMPAFQNPIGRSLPGEQRRKLLALAARHDLFVVEDDTFGFLPLGKSAPPPLREEAPERVFHLGGLSKALFAGIRIGWLVSPPTLSSELLEYHRATSLCGSPLLERAVGHFLEEGHLEEHLNRVLPIYRRRRDALIESIGDSLGPDYECSRPEGGYCCWVSTGTPLSEARFVSEALARGIAVAAGSAFRVEPASGLEFRLCYGHLPSRRIRRAVKVLAEVLRGLPRREDSGAPPESVYV